MLKPADRAARERKQKIFVVVGGLLLLGLLAIQLPRLLGGSSGSTPAPTSTLTSTVAGEPGTTQLPASSHAPVALVNTDRALPPAPGQLSSFSEFAGKDPFVQQVTFDDGVASGGSAAKGEGKEGSTKAPSKDFTVGGSQTASVTVISVNGARQALSPGAAFPASDPMFVLVSEQLKTKTVTIGIAGGAYASGSKTTKLLVGKPLVLVNTTTGARYKLVLVAVGNGEATPKTSEKGSDSGKSESSKSTTESTP